jgi:hypothetical protein
MSSRSFFSLLAVLALAPACVAESTDDEIVDSEEEEVRVVTPSITFQGGRPQAKGLPAETKDGVVAYIDSWPVGQSDKMNYDLVVQNKFKGTHLRYGLADKAQVAAAQRILNLHTRWTFVNMARATESEGQMLARTYGHLVFVTLGPKNAPPLLRVTKPGMPFTLVREQNLQSRVFEMVDANPGCNFEPVVSSAFVSKARNLISVKVDYGTAGARCPDISDYFTFTYRR